jgi:hypothetical protein
MHFHEGLRDLCFDFGLVVKLADQPLANLRDVDIEIVLDSDIHFGCGGANVAGEPSMGFKRLPQRI